MAAPSNPNQLAREAPRKPAGCSPLRLPLGTVLPGCVLSSKHSSVLLLKWRGGGLGRLVRKDSAKILSLQTSVMLESRGDKL